MSNSQKTPIILVTGGAGFIGSHITDVLATNGYRVIIADNLSSKNSGYRNPSATYITVNILSDEFETLFKDYQIEACVHLAANASVSISNQNPEYDAIQNIIGSLHVINLCKKYHVKKLIAASSAAVYGNPQYLPIDEKHPTNPISYYGLSKLTMEHYIKLSGLDYIIFRFANVYGERQTSQGEAGVISIFDNAMYKHLDVFVDGDGEQTRDFIYVKDIAKAVMTAINSDIKNKIINVSTNTALSVNDLFSLMKKIYAYPKSAQYREARAGDIKASRLDNTLFMTLISDKQTPFVEGLKNLCNATKGCINE